MSRLALTTILVLISAGLASAAPAWGQTHSSYAGEQSRAIKALSPKEFDDLAQGRGMGLAKAAELNRYPGPMHALELADLLSLSSRQRQALESIKARMNVEAKAVGGELLGLERELDAGFAARKIDAQRLKAVHLVAHIETAAVMSAEQIARYDHLRGYGGNRIAPMPESGHGGHGAPKH